MKNSNVKMLLFSTIAVLALSCNSGSKETEKNNETPTETTVKAEHHHDEHEAIDYRNTMATRTTRTLFIYSRLWH